MNDVSIETWTALRQSLLEVVGDLVDRADGLDDPLNTFTEISRAIDALALCPHPFEHAGTWQ